MNHSTTQLCLTFHPCTPVEISFDAPTLSSDGGALLLRALDEKIQLCQRFAALLPDEREQSKVEHSRLEQVRQRVYQQALGYPDCNDANFLRHDPVLKTVCDRLPKEPIGLSSQPTLCRLENAIDMRAICQLLRMFEDSYIQSLPENTTAITIDVDSTDDPTYGEQQLSFFHGFYEQHMYHPLLFFDGDSGQLISCLLRPGNSHAGKGALPLLTRIIRGIKKRFPRCQIGIRADAGFCLPRLLNGLEQLNQELGDIDYLIGIAKNAVLLRLTESAREEAKQSYDWTRGHIRQFTQVEYAAKTWPADRRIVVKAEHYRKGENPRFVVTSLRGFSADLLYQGYCQRGQAENRIKDFKNAIQADRLSCSNFVANFFRLLIAAAGYRLMQELRQISQLHSEELGRAQFDTLRLRLLKVGAWVTQSVRRIWIRLPKTYPLIKEMSQIMRTLTLDTS